MSVQDLQGTLSSFCQPCPTAQETKRGSDGLMGMLLLGRDDQGSPCQETLGSAVPLQLLPISLCAALHLSRSLLSSLLLLLLMKRKVPMLP